MKKTGLIILIIGALATIVTVLNLSFFTRENVVDIGDLQINAREKHTATWSPYFGVAIMTVGVGVYLLGTRNKS